MKIHAIRGVQGDYDALLWGFDLNITNEFAASLDVSHLACGHAVAHEFAARGLQNAWIPIFDRTDKVARCRGYER